MRPPIHLVAATAWVVLALALVILSLALTFARGEDPSACGTCPDYWQQQMHLREATP